MRFSTSRTESRYSLTRVRSGAPRRFFRCDVVSESESKTLAFPRGCAVGFAAELKIRSKAARGAASMGSGAVGDAQLIVFLYEQLSTWPHTPATSSFSIPRCIEASRD